MNIKIISLKKSIDRREFIKNQFINLNLDYDFFDAIDPDDFSQEMIKKFIKEFESIYNRYPTKGEIGASLSHDLARKNFLKENNQNILMVLEDDAKIMCDKSNLINVAEIFEDSFFDIMILGFSKCDDSFEKHINIVNPLLSIYSIKNEIKIGVRKLHTTCGAVGYLIKRKSIEKISAFLSFSVIADDWDSFAKKGIQIAYTKPMLVRENFLELPSYAGHQNISQKQYKDDRVWIKILLICRKHIYGFFRIMVLYLKFFNKKN